MDDLLTPAQAANLLGIDRTTLFRWQQLGHITPAMKLAGATGPHLYSRSEVERVAAERTTAARPDDAA